MHGKHISTTVMWYVKYISGSRRAKAGTAVDSLEGKEATAINVASSGTPSGFTKRFHLKHLV